MSFKDVLTGIGLGIGFFIGQTLMQVVVTYLVLWLAGVFETGIAL